MDGQRVLVRKVHYKTSLVLATFQLVIGMATLALYIGIAVLYFDGSHNFWSTWQFGGIFCTLCIFATGTIGVFSANNLEDTALSIGYVIFCVMSMLAAFAQVVLFITKVSMWISMHRYYICMSVLILVFMVLEFFVSILASVYCCTNAGFCNTESDREIVTVEEEVLESVRTGSMIKGKDVVVANDMTSHSYNLEQSHQPSIRSLNSNDYLMKETDKDVRHYATSPTSIYTTKPSMTVVKPSTAVEEQPSTTVEVQPQPSTTSNDPFAIVITDEETKVLDDFDIAVATSGNIVIPDNLKDYDNLYGEGYVPIPPDNLEDYENVYREGYVPIPPKDSLSLHSKEGSLRIKNKLTRLASSFQEFSEAIDVGVEDAPLPLYSNSEDDDDEDDEDEEDDDEEDDEEDDDEDDDEEEEEEEYLKGYSLMGETV